MTMNFILAFFVFMLCLIGLGLGFIIARKALVKGCSVDPESCKCRREGKDPEKCDEK